MFEVSYDKFHDDIMAIEIYVSGNYACGIVS